MINVRYHDELINVKLARNIESSHPYTNTRSLEAVYSRMIRI